MPIQQTIQQALSDGHSPEEIWTYLSKNHATVQQALSDGHNPKEIQGFLGLTITKPSSQVTMPTPSIESPPITPGVNAPIPGAPMPSPPQYLEQERMLQGLPAQIQQASSQLQMQEPPIPIPGQQYTSFRQMAGRQGLLPIMKKEKTLPMEYLKKTNPIEYNAGRLTGLILTAKSMSGIPGILKKSPTLWLWAQRYGLHANEVINMVAEGARWAATFGSKELADQLGRVWGGEKPEAKKIIGEPLKQAGFGAVLGGTVGIESTGLRLAATGAASTAYDGLMKLVEKGKITKEDIPEILLMAGIRTAVRAIDAPRLTAQYKRARMEEHLQNKLIAKVMYGQPSTPEAFAAAKKTIVEIEQLPRELGRAYQKAVNDIWMGRQVYEQVIQQKFPGLEGIPKDMQEKMMGPVINAVAQGATIDQAIDTAAEMSKPITEEALMYLQSLTGGIPSPLPERVPVQPKLKLTPGEQLGAQFSGAVPSGKPVTTPPIEIEKKPEILAQKVNKLIKGEVKEVKEGEQIYYSMLKNQISAAEADKRGYTDPITKEFIQAPQASTFPDWATNMDWTKNKIMRVFEKIEKGIPFRNRDTEQKAILSAMESKVEALKREEEHWEEITPETIEADQLKKGQKLEIKGEKYKVIEEAGPRKELVIKDGEEMRFGPFEDVEYDRGSLTEKPKITLSQEEQFKKREHLSAQEKKAEELTKALGIKKAKPKKVVKIEDWLKSKGIEGKQEEKILNNPLASKKQKTDIVEKRIDRASQIGEQIGDPKYKNLVTETKEHIGDIKNDGDLKNFPKELQGFDDASILRDFRPIRFEARRNDQAYNLYKLGRKASMEHQALKLKLIREARETAKKLKLTDKDMEIISKFREKTPDAPMTLTGAQAKFNDWLTIQYGAKPGEGLHGLFGVEKYVPGGYNPRRPAENLLTIEEKLINIMYGDPAKIPENVNEFFKKERTGELKDRKLNALKLYEEYVHTGAKALFFNDALKVYKDTLPTLPPAMKRLMEDYIYRLLGYPSPAESAWSSTLNTMFRDMGKFGIKLPKLKDQDAQQIARVLLDLGYIRHMGLRPKSAVKNLLQTINNTVPELGYGWTVDGLSKLFLKGFDEAREAGIFFEFAPELYKEISTAIGRSDWDKVRDGLMCMFQFADRINRTIAYYGSTDKFNFHLKSYDKYHNIDKFLHKLEADKFDRLVKKDISDALTKGKIDEARKLFAEEIVGKTQYLYNKEDAPIITRSAGGKLFYQYQSWRINYAQLLADDLKSGNWKAWARRLLLYGALYKTAKEMPSKVKKLLKNAMLFGPFEFGFKLDLVVPALTPLADILVAGSYPIRHWDKFSGRKFKKEIGKKLEKNIPSGAKEIYKAVKKKDIKELL